MTYTTAFVLVVMAVMTHLLVLLVFMTLLHHERVANIAARRPREAEEEFSRTSEASVSEVKEIDDPPSYEALMVDEVPPPSFDSLVDPKGFSEVARSSSKESLASSTGFLAKEDSVPDQDNTLDNTSEKTCIGFHVESDTAGPVEKIGREGNIYGKNQGENLNIENFSDGIFAEIHTHRKISLIGIRSPEGKGEITHATPRKIKAQNKNCKEIQNIKIIDSFYLEKEVDRADAVQDKLLPTNFTKVTKKYISNLSSTDVNSRKSINIKYLHHQNQYLARI
ncbi:uncharacterized protein LOC108680027 [Hyalella azteca]|uniref:Uncharacterized protein LOC108680027 n=1 Tax=Hyalella azteca TaxID=294128 RepID=A0A8B7PFA0_HYAAZ|nr:uncharacterized protein LOC108680027 [Hyalella azteca]